MSVDVSVQVSLRSWLTHVETMIRLRQACLGLSTSKPHRLPIPMCRGASVDTTARFGQCFLGLSTETQDCLQILTCSGVSVRSLLRSPPKHADITVRLLPAFLGFVAVSRDCSSHHGDSGHGSKCDGRKFHCAGKCLAFEKVGDQLKVCLGVTR